MLTGNESNEYKRGYQTGFDDYVLQWWQLQKYPLEFQRGYRAGKDEIDRLVDEVAQSDYSYHRDEY